MTTMFLCAAGHASLPLLFHACAEGLAEHKIRDLNDQINKLLREKYHWEKRIKELGGPDHTVRCSRSCVHPLRCPQFHSCR